jgi:hypothetical protein
MRFTEKVMEIVPDCRKDDNQVTIEVSLTLEGVF